MSLRGALWLKNPSVDYLFQGEEKIILPEYKHQLY